MKRLIPLLCIFSLAVAMLSCSNPASTPLSSKDSLDIYNNIRGKQAGVKDSLPLSKSFFTFFSDSLPGGDTISFGNADTLITEFRRAFPVEGTAPMRTLKADKNLQGFFVQRAAFDRMFKGNNHGGFMIFFGKKSGMPDNVCTVVLMPTDTDPKSKWPTKIHPELSWEEVDPCPDKCGDDLPRDARSYPSRRGNFGEPK